MTVEECKIIQEYHKHLKVDIAGAWSNSNTTIYSSNLVKGCKRVIDIGSGTGKFCLIAAKLNPDIHFTGVEITEKYWEESMRLKDILGITNVEFLLQDYKDVDITNFDGIYIFNPFVMSKDDPYGKKYQFGIKQDKEYFELVEKFKADLLKANVGTKLIMYNPFCSISRKTGFSFRKSNTKQFVSYLRYYKKNGTQVSNSK
jgi:SAM-dependent methyltransferase